MELLNPLGVVDIRFTSGHILRVTRVYEHDVKATRLENLEQRDPVDTRRLHRDGRNAETTEPIRERVQIRREALERTNRFRIKLLGYRHNVKAQRVERHTEPRGSRSSPGLRQPFSEAPPCVPAL